MMQSMSKLTVIGIVLLMIATIPTAYAIVHHSDVSISGNSFTYRIISDNPVTISDETPGYIPEKDTFTVRGNTYDSIKIVNEDNTDTGGIADEDGNVNVQFTMNDERPFCFVIHHINGENSKLRILVTIDGVTKQYSSNISLDVYHYIGREDKYFSLPTLIRNEDWISSASEINVSIYNYNGHVPNNVTLSVLFV